MKQCGLPCKSNNTFEIVKDFTCFICCDTYELTQVYSLTCNHQFCIQCYYQYLMNEVNNGRLITCMDPSCKYTIPFQDVAHIIAIIEAEKTLIVAEKPLRENPMLITATREWVDTRNSFKWCPATDCTSFTEIADASTIKTVRDPLTCPWFQLLDVPSIMNFALSAITKTTFHVLVGWSRRGLKM